MDAHLRELRYFVTVAEELNFTRAGERLFVSQSALSKQIRALEGRLGFDLFDRHGRTVTLTLQGGALLSPARALLAEWDRAYAEARALGRAEVLVVGMQTAVGRDIRPFPDWTLSLRLVGWNDPTAGLADASSDVAFAWSPIPGDGISRHSLAREDRWVALPADHRLADRAEVPFRDLQDEPFIALPSEAGPARDFWLATDDRDRPARIAAEATAAEEVFEAVASGVGVALLAEGNAKLCQRPGVVFRRVTDLTPAELVIAWRTADTRPAVQEYIKAIVSAP